MMLKGWGVCILEFIFFGSFLCEFIGELFIVIVVVDRENDEYFFNFDFYKNVWGCGKFLKLK